MSQASQRGERSAGTAAYIRSGSVSPGKDKKCVGCEDLSPQVESSRVTKGAKSGVCLSPERKREEGMKSRCRPMHSFNPIPSKAEGTEHLWLYMPFVDLARFPRTKCLKVL